jgi:hypothetical protein
MSNPLLSILICTVTERIKDERFLIRLLNILQNQIKNKYESEVEVLVYCDDKRISIGKKRDLLIEQAKGKFTCFIDDDDVVPDYYVERLVTIIKNNPDIDFIGWKLQYIHNGMSSPKPSIHSMRYNKWSEDQYGYYRHMSHLNPVLRTKSSQVKFEDINFGEDHIWSNNVYGLLTKEYFIDDYMYYYLFFSQTSLSGNNKNTQHYQQNEKDVKEILSPFESNKFMKFTYLLQ